MFSFSGFSRLEPQAKDRWWWRMAWLAGLCAALGNFVYLNRAEAQKLTMLKAKTSLPAQTQIDETMFEPMTISGELHQMKGVFISQQSLGAFRGRLLAEDLPAGQPLMLRSFLSEGIQCCPAGKRAVSLIAADETSTLSQLLRPGHSVDVWGTQGEKSVLLKQRACVLAVGEQHHARREAETRSGDYRAVTILVDEKDVSCLSTMLNFAEGKTRVALVGECQPQDSFPALCPAPSPLPSSTPMATPSPAARRR